MIDWKIVDEGYLTGVVNGVWIKILKDSWVNLSTSTSRVSPGSQVVVRK